MLFISPQLAQMIFKTWLSLLVHPVLWLLMLLVWFQYRRASRLKMNLYGMDDDQAWRQTFLSVFAGFFGGLLGSYILVFIGVSLTNIGIGYLWLLALLLMLINPRFICFAYAGSLLAISSLLFGFPQVDIPQLMGLVAVLHLVESLLILISGGQGALPVYTRNKHGQIVGAFTLQKFWPIPIVTLFLSPLPLGGPLSSPLAMPSWWPLLHAANSGGEQAVYLLLPVIAGLGYSDLSVTLRPAAKIKRAAASLAVYSMVLLTLAIIASYLHSLVLLAVLFSSLGHEYIIRMGQRQELTGRPFYVPHQHGVKVLYVRRNSLAARLGLKSGDVIYMLNQVSINTNEAFQALLAYCGGRVKVRYWSCGSGKWRDREGKLAAGLDFGVIPVPEATDPVYVEFANPGIFRWLKGVMRGK